MRHVSLSEKFFSILQPTTKDTLNIPLPFCSGMASHMTLGLFLHTPTDLVVVDSDHCAFCHFVCASMRQNFTMETGGQLVLQFIPMDVLVPKNSFPVALPQAADSEKKKSGACSLLSPADRKKRKAGARHLSPTLPPSYLPILPVLPLLSSYSFSFAGKGKNRWVTVGWYSWA